MFIYDLYNVTVKYICAFSRTWHWLQVFPLLAPVTWFPALGAGYTFSRVRHQLHVFPRLPLVTCFPMSSNWLLMVCLSMIFYTNSAFKFVIARLGVCAFSRTWHQLHVFPHLAPVTCFPALCTAYMFQSRARHRLQLFVPSYDWFIYRFVYVLNYFRIQFYFFFQFQLISLTMTWENSSELVHSARSSLRHARKITSLYVEFNILVHIKTLAFDSE